MTGWSSGIERPSRLVSEKFARRAGSHRSPPAFDQDMAGKPCPRHAIGMTDRDRTAVDVELVEIDAELVLKMKRCVIDQPGPPYSFGQSGAMQPCL